MLIYLDWCSGKHIVFWNIRNVIRENSRKIAGELAFRVHLNAETAEKEIQSLINSIRENIVPKRWIITPDATPENIVEIMGRNGFRNLLTDTMELEPSMILDKADFHIQKFADVHFSCRRVGTKEDIIMEYDGSL